MGREGEGGVNKTGETLGTAARSDMDRDKGRETRSPDALFPRRVENSRDDNISVYAPSTYAALDAEDQSSLCWTMDAPSPRLQYPTTAAAAPKWTSMRVLESSKTLAYYHEVKNDQHKNK